MEEQIKHPIYIAEDDQDDYAFFEEAFHEKLPHAELVWTQNGDELLNALSKTDNSPLPSLIILDYNMPRLNGMQTLERLNANSRFKNIPKVMYTGATYKEYQEEGFRKGIKAYVVKGHSISDIRQNVSDILKVLDE